MKQFDLQKEAFKNSMALVMLPLLTTLFEILNKIDPKVVAIVAIIGTTVIVVITIMRAINSVISILHTFDGKSLKTTAIIVGVTAALIALAAIIAVIVGKGSQLNETMASVGNSVSSMTNTVNGAGNKIGRNATGTSNWRGGLTWVNEEGKGEIMYLPNGTKIIPHDISMKMASQAQSGEVYNFYGDVIMPAKDIKEMQYATDFFRRLKQVKRQGVR
jgi:hypothetical protein